MLHPVAWAGWVGLLVTGINLIPAGQLDGGHIFYIDGQRRQNGYFRLLLGQAALGIFWYGWRLWAALIFFLGRSCGAAGPDHPTGWQKKDPWFYCVGRFRPCVHSCPAHFYRSLIRCILFYEPGISPSGYIVCCLVLYDPESQVFSLLYKSPVFR